MATLLYSSKGSSCSWRLRLALLLKDIPFVLRPVNLQDGEHFTEEFRQLNPMSQVPVLVMDGTAIADSNACLEYLEERFPDKRRLLPIDPLQRAAVRTAVAIVVSNIQPFQNGRLVREIRDERGEEASLRWAQHYIDKGFGALERFLESRAGCFSFGDAISLADVVLVPQVYNARLYKVDMSQYPTLLRISDTLFQLPEVKASSPDQHP